MTPEKIRVLYIAYSLLPVSEASCGGAEQALLLIESQMHLRGHRTTVAACTGSCVAGELLATGSSPREDDAFETRDAEHVVRVLEFVRAQQHFQPFDLIHDHGGSFWKHAGNVDVPVLATLHLPRHFYPANAFSGMPANVAMNCVSETQAQSFRDVGQLAGVVRNGVDLKRFPFSRDKGDYLLWLGRICPEKGAHVALDVARECGMPIVLAGQVYPFSYHQSYFRREVKTRLSAMQNSARFMDVISFQEKVELLRNARALLIPSLVEETSSLVAMEAMACGTPVICFRCGALPEVVSDGETGRVVDSAEEMIAAIATTDQIDSRKCRERVERHFSATRVAEDYEQLYRRAMSWLPQMAASMEGYSASGSR